MTFVDVLSSSKVDGRADASMAKMAQRKDGFSTRRKHHGGSGSLSPLLEGPLWYPRNPSKDETPTSFDDESAAYMGALKGTSAETATGCGRLGRLVVSMRSRGARIRIAPVRKPSNAQLDERLKRGAERVNLHSALSWVDSIGYVRCGSRDNRFQGSVASHFRLLAQRFITPVSASVDLPIRLKYRR